MVYEKKLKMLKVNRWTDKHPDGCQTKDDKINLFKLSFRRAKIQIRHND